MNEIRESYEIRKRRYEIASATNCPTLPRLQADLVRAYNALVACSD